MWNIGSQTKYCVCVQKRHNSSRKASSSRRKDQRNVQNVLWQNNGSWIQWPHAPHKYMFMYSGELIRFKDISTFLKSCQIFSCSINLMKTFICTFFSFFPLAKPIFLLHLLLRQPCSVFVRHNTLEMMKAFALFPYTLQDRRKV